MPTHRGLWRNLETPKQAPALRKLSANYRRPRGTGHLERLDASPRRIGSASGPFAGAVARRHKIILLELDYPKQGDAVRTTRVSARLIAPGAGTGTVTPVVVNYDGTNTTSLDTQNEVDTVTPAANGSYELVAQPGTQDFAGRRLYTLPQQFPNLNGVPVKGGD